MKVLIPYSGGVNSIYALWRWLVETDHEIVAVYASEKWDKALERAPREEAAALIVSKCEIRHDPSAMDGSAVLCMSCLYDQCREDVAMSGADLDAAFAQHGSYGKWRSEADPKTYTYRGKSQIKALELLGIKL